jgi:hypothetical protein
MVVLKLQPVIDLTRGLQAEIGLIRHLSHTMPHGMINLFLTMNQGEIVAFVRGENIERLLKAVDEQVRAISITDLGQNNDIAMAKIGQMIVASSKIYPLVSYANIIVPKLFEKLQGEVRAVTACSVATSRTNFELGPLKGMFTQCYRSFGKSDFVALTEKPQPFGQMIQALTEFRRSRPRDGVLMSTDTTVYLPQAVASVDAESAAGGVDPASDHSPGMVPVRPLDRWRPLKRYLDVRLGLLMRRAEKLRVVVQKLEAQRRPYLLQDVDLLARLVSTLYNTIGDPRVSIDILDLVPFARRISVLIHEHIDRADKSSGRPGENFSFLLYLANSALVQRRSSLMQVLEGSSLDDATLNRVVGTRTLLAAGDFGQGLALQIPELYSSSAGQSAIWVFADTAANYNFAYVRGGVFTFPEWSLDDPIGLWSPVTHELAHGVFEEGIGRRGNDYAMMDKAKSEVQENASSIGVKLDESLVGTLSEELFANYFDYYCFFRSDLKFYMRAIWSPWLKLERVWRLRTGYLMRSFSVYLARNPEISRPPGGDGRARFDELCRRYDDHLQFVKASLEGTEEQGQFVEYSGMAEGHGHFIANEVVALATAFFPVLQAVVWLSKNWASTLGGNREDSEEDLQTYRGLGVGEVSSAGVRDPHRALLYLLRTRYQSSFRERANFAANAALIISLAADNRRRFETFRWTPMLESVDE